MKRRVVLRRTAVWAAPVIVMIGVVGKSGTAQVAAPAPPATFPTLVAVRQIEPPTKPLPPEEMSASETRFSFIAYGDTRQALDQAVLEENHDKLVDAIVAKIKALESTDFPVRFVVQTGDAAYNGAKGEQLNIGFTPIIEKITKVAGVPYFLTLGNHDVAFTQEMRPLGVHNTLAAISKLIPPEGSPRRLNGYATYAIGYGNVFVISIDSNIGDDRLQLAWVTDQLEKLDRARYRHVIAFFHHPPFSSGPHGGVTPSASGGPRTDDNVEIETAWVRNLYIPLFRRFHVRMTLTGHDHLYDHFVEHYTDAGTTYRRDDVLTGGGGAPSYAYRGEPELTRYLASGAAQRVRVDHLVKPGATPTDNPNHFIVIQVDQDKLALEIFGVRPYAPYGGKTTIELRD